MKEVDGDMLINMAMAMGRGGSKPLPSGNDCPECEGELLFTEPNIIHHDPLRKRVRCSTCSYRGFLAVEL